jgi:hypothetical protein
MSALLWLAGIEMLEREGQHRPLVGVRKAQCLQFDLARELVAQRIPAEHRQAPTIVVELGEDFAQLGLPGPVIGGCPRQVEDPAVIPPVKPSIAVIPVCPRGSPSLPARRSDDFHPSSMTVCLVSSMDETSYVKTRTPRFSPGG